jgi:hypothetical protein
LKIKICCEVVQDNFAFLKFEILLNFNYPLKIKLSRFKLNQHLTVISLMYMDGMTLFQAQPNISGRDLNFKILEDEIKIISNLKVTNYNLVPKIKKKLKKKEKES